MVSLLVWILIGIFVLAFFGWLIGLYNSLVQLKNNIKKSFANIDVLLKQRSDELPKLIDTIKGYMKHEKETLQKLTEARTAMQNASSTGQKAAADNMMTGALKSLFAVAENYPDLKAQKSFAQLQTRISGLENELADRREFYNDSVNIYNIRIHQFPAVLLAGMLGYSEEELFKASAQDRKDVDVSFE